MYSRLQPLDFGAITFGDRPRVEGLQIINTGLQPDERFSYLARREVRRSTHGLARP